ncbi:envelope protein UL43 [Pteropodid alphaherpesvirus 1]|uniref:Envelope protein UL43 n=1 Tax=Pteropodid alphaherpesvirus 1 TaxID=1343901 RepID=A0A060Q1W2_9ALPH|nr:envelope protein UL43 [Pteropodid alphaherpesvirus 1]BAP00722.1 envelope protein UL43 [Pteropodid alphaherpesvirus 1]
MAPTTQALLPPTSLSKADPVSDDCHRGTTSTLRCVLWVVRGFVWLWLQAAMVGFGGVAALSFFATTNTPYVVFVAGSLCLSFVPLPRPACDSLVSVCAWARLLIGGAGIVLWSTDLWKQPRYGPIALQCAAIGTAWLTLVVLLYDFQRFFGAARPIFFVSLGNTIGGFAIGASAQYWRLPPLVAVAMASAVLVLMGPHTTWGYISKACPLHARLFVPEAPLELPPPAAAQLPHPRSSRFVNIWLPLVTFYIAMILSANHAKNHPQLINDQTTELWLQVFILGHVMAALTELCQLISPYDFTNALLGLHIVLLLINRGIMEVAKTTALFIMLGCSIWLALTQVFGLQRRLRNAGATDSWIVAGPRGLFFSVYAVGFATGKLILVPHEVPASAL